MKRGFWTRSGCYRNEWEKIDQKAEMTMLVEELDQVFEREDEGLLTVPVDGGVVGGDPAAKTGESHPTTGVTFGG